MSANHTPRNILQKATCMLLAVIIVSTALTIGVLGASYPALHGYSVTITQLS